MTQERPFPCWNPPRPPQPPPLGGALLDRPGSYGITRELGGSESTWRIANGIDGSVEHEVWNGERWVRVSSALSHEAFLRSVELLSVR